MKWTKEDVKVGSFVCRPPRSEKPDGWDAKWLHLVGYSGSSSRLRLVSLADGAVFLEHSPDEFVEVLNRDGFVPASPEWVREVLSYLNK